MNKKLSDLRELISKRRALLTEPKDDVTIDTTNSGNEAESIKDKQLATESSDTSKGDIESSNMEMEETLKTDEEPIAIDSDTGIDTSVNTEDSMQSSGEPEITESVSKKKRRRK